MKMRIEYQTAGGSLLLLLLVKTGMRAMKAPASMTPAPTILPIRYLDLSSTKETSMITGMFIWWMAR